ncbi:uncharacterized protein LOC101741916 isoform X1 [Bombyx mori]|uniref:protein kinase C n=1 Tax=Bombyx mori TaxID=7091 RepID=A0A8R2C6K8_BOMMO|nr:uncharacterized protein LOC101741916 isoform X1 [Bombyx mori]
MPLFSEHISNMYYSGSASYSSPYSYNSSLLPLGTSYSASYLNPGGSYSNHSSLSGYSRTPLSSRWIPGVGRCYAPILSTISERSTASPSRINSPRRIPLSKRNYSSSGYTSRPININTADIDVSRDKYKQKVEDSSALCKEIPETGSEEKENGPFMPRVDGKPETGIDSSPGTQRSTIKRGRTVVRFHTLKRKERDSPRKPVQQLQKDTSSERLDVDKTGLNETKNQESLRWRERLSDDLIYKDKKVKKTLGTKLVEKFALKDDVLTSGDKQPVIEDSGNDVEVSDTRSISEASMCKLTDRRCSVELLAEQAKLLDSLIRNENLSTTTLDVSKVGTTYNSKETTKPPSVVKNKTDEKRNSLKTAKSDHSLHDSLKSLVENKEIKKKSGKRRSLKKSLSGGSICRLDSITEFPKEPIKLDLPPIKEKTQEKVVKKPRLKTKITSSVEVTTPQSPLKFIIEDVIVEQKLRPIRKGIIFTSEVEETPTPTLKLEKRKLEGKEEASEIKVESESASPDPDDGNFWNKIGKRETVYLIKRKKKLEEMKEQNKRALFWFPEEEDESERNLKSEKNPVTVENTNLNESNESKTEQTILSGDIDKTVTKVIPKAVLGDLDSDHNSTNIEKVEQSSFEAKVIPLNQNECTNLKQGNTEKAEPKKVMTPKLKNDSEKLPSLKNKEDYIIDQREKNQDVMTNNNNNKPSRQNIGDEQKTLQEPSAIKARSNETDTETTNLSTEAESIKTLSSVINDSKSELNQISLKAEVVDKPNENKETTKPVESCIKQKSVSLKQNSSEKTQTDTKSSSAKLKEENKESTSLNHELKSLKETEVVSKKKKIIKVSKSNKASEEKSTCKTVPSDKKLTNQELNFECDASKLASIHTKKEQPNSKIITMSNEKVESNADQAALSSSTGPDMLINDKESKLVINASIKNETHDKISSVNECAAHNINATTSVPVIPIVLKSENIPNNNNNISVPSTSQDIVKTEETKSSTILNAPHEEMASTNEDKKSSIGIVTLPVPPITKKPVKPEPALRPLIATPRPLQKKPPQVIRSSDSSDSSSEEDSSDDDSESDSSEESEEFYECEVNIDGRTSTGSNDSGFDSSAPASPALFSQIKKDCDVNCHRKCEKLTANLCGVNQRLLVEALATKNPSKKGGENPGTSSCSSSANCSTDILEQELEQSTAYGIFRKTGRFTPPARSIPRFRKYTVEDFHFIKVLGKGSFGKVLLAELRDTEYYYAVKCLKKDVVLEDDDVECTLIERKVLALGTNHPYLCHLFATFQTDSHLFFVMEYLNGGDLMFHIQQSGRFPEATARFYAAEIVSGLKFLHKRGIIYRDLKLDNILLDFDGHVRIADFGMCKLQIYLDKTADTFCGTPDYMAPEIIKGLKYNQTVDWWSFGVLLYEMLIGQSPFSGCDEDELFWSICNEMPSYPRFLSKQSLSILTRLLDKDARTRLGGVECMHGDIREQDFFHAIHWDRLERRELEAPFRPRVRHPMDTQYFDRAFTGERPRLTAVEPQVLRSMDQEPFRGFSYTNPNATDR